MQPAIGNVAPAVDALVFDLGGVLVGIDWDRVFEYWSDQSGLPATLLKDRFQFDDAYAAHERNELSSAAYFAHLRTALGTPLTDEQIRGGWIALLGDPLEGIAELLRDLDGILPLYGLSNTNAEHFTSWQPRYRDVLAPLTRVFCSHEMRVRKPDQEVFARVTAGIGVVPRRIAFFDDLQQNVDGAREAGWQAFATDRATAMRRILIEELRILPAR